MAKISSSKKQELIQEVAERIVEMQDATTSVDLVAADHLGVNITDLLCLGHLVRRGAHTPSALAALTDRTPGAITVAVDRLEAVGLARRAPDPGDRRRTRVEATEKAIALTAEIWGPIAEEGVAQLSRYTTSQLAEFADMLRRGTDMQQRHARRIRDLGSDQDQPRAD